MVCVAVVDLTLVPLHAATGEIGTLREISFASLMLSENRRVSSDKSMDLEVERKVKPRFRKINR